MKTRLTVERRKHADKHNKPHRCEEPSCARVEGFSSRNDLDRHQKSVHKIRSGKEYRCTLDKCHEIFKLWPRSDNFRAHLKSVHKATEAKVGNRDYLDSFLHRYAQTTLPHKPPPFLATR